MNTLGKYIRKKRNEKELGLRELARLADISHSYLSQIENDIKKDPKSYILRALAQELDVEQDELLKLAGYITEEKSANEILSDVKKIADENKGKWKNTTPEESKTMVELQKEFLEGKAHNIEDLLLLNNFYIKYKGKALMPEEKKKILYIIDLFYELKSIDSETKNILLSTLEKILN